MCKPAAGKRRSKNTLVLMIYRVHESNGLFEDEKVIEIEIERLRSFKDHPFKVTDDNALLKFFSYDDAILVHGKS